MGSQTSSFVPKIVLGVAAHPDDLDFCAAGSVAQFVAGGAEVYYLFLTDGAKGTSDRELSPEVLVQTRRDEQRAAAKELGVADVFFLNYPDGALEVSMDVKRDIVKSIRKLKPDTVITLDPTLVYSAEDGFINHADHRAAGQATLDAVYPLARDHLSFPELLTEGYEPHVVGTVLLADFGVQNSKPNFFLDITGAIDKKCAAVAAHSSQALDSVPTVEKIKTIASRFGATADCTYAEAFTRIDVQP